MQRALQVLDPVPLIFAKLGLSIPPAPPAGGSVLASSGHALTPFQAVIWSMSIGSALKQIFWQLVIANEPMTPTNAVLISVFNTVNNGLNTLAFSLAAINPTWSSNLFYISIPLYAVGILVETFSEVQRKAFKDDSRNKGKLYSGGLFSFARHINYFGYMIWRSSFAAAAGGAAWGALVAAFFAYDFCNRSIPVLDYYFTRKYGVKWEEVKKKVPYAFAPGIY